jgi:hypothetical protein
VAAQRVTLPEVDSCRGPEDVEAEGSDPWPGVVKDEEEESIVELLKQNTTFQCLRLTKNK